MGYFLHLLNMTSADRLWNQPGDYSQSQTAIYKNVDEWIYFSDSDWLELHVNPPANSSEQAGVDQIRWTFVAGKL